MTGVTEVRARARRLVRAAAARVDTLRTRPRLPTLTALETLPTLGPDGRPVDTGTGRPRRLRTAADVDVAEVAAFLALEARCLDERRWGDWLELWTDELTYAMPTRRSVQPVGDDRPVDDELTPEGGVWWFDDDRESLTMRIDKLRTGKAWVEEPPSRTRRFVTNIEVEPGDDGSGDLVVRSNVLVHRGRRDADVEWFSAGRRDRIVAGVDGLRLRDRLVVIDTNVVDADTLLLFF